MCFQYDDSCNNDISGGGFWKKARDGKCNGCSIEAIVNEDDAYSLWIEYCYNKEEEGCLCNKKVSGGIKIVKPKANGKCPRNSGPLLDPEALRSGAIALHCAEG